jgi:hypothetical protein
MIQDIRVMLTQHLPKKDLAIGIRPTNIKKKIMKKITSFSKYFFVEQL